MKIGQSLQDLLTPPSVPAYNHGSSLRILTAEARYCKAPM